MTPFLSLDEITLERLAAPQTIRLAVSGQPLAFDAPLEDRCIRYVFSDPSVGRDMHRIQSGAWDTENFEKNPVFLWAHQDDGLPIGRVENLATEGSRLVGQVRYADHDLAETCYRMVKGGFLNATSTNWLPRKWQAANDRSRPGGVDFTDVELLEISQVPVPALPTALVTARKSGIDTRPLVAWAERLLDSNNFAILPRNELMALRKSAKEPKSRKSTETIAPVEPVVAAIDASAAEGAPEEPKDRRSALTGVYGAAVKRGLNHVAELAMHIRSLEDLHDRMCNEREAEGDMSPVPEQMRAWLDDGHALLARSLGEESAEYHSGTQAPEPVYWSAAALEAAVSRAIENAGLKRKGAKFSAETKRCMRQIHGHVKTAHEKLAEMLSDPDDSQDEDNDFDPNFDPDQDDDERAHRARKAKALALKARLTA